MKKQYVALAILEPYGAEFLEAEHKAQEAQSSGAEEPESKLLSMYEDVGIVEVKGKLTNRDSRYNSWFGLISYNEIRAAAVEAVELGAGAILFDIDSPGGAVAGIGDISKFIQGLDVPTVAHTSGTMASAAYFIGASTEKVFADDMSESGSIGVVMQHMEMTALLKKEGIKVDVIRSGKRKAIGGPYEKLEPENRKYLQDQVDTYADKFFGFVSEQRGIPLPAMTEIMEGGTFIGQEAVMAGLVDKIMSFDEALLVSIKLAEKTLDNQQDTSDYYGNGHTFSKSTAEGDNTMPKKISKAALEALATAGKTTPAVENEELKPVEGEGVKPEGEDVKPNAEEQKPAEEPTQEEKLQADLTAMQEKYDASQVDLAELTTNKEKTEAVLETLKATHLEELGPMAEVIRGQINTMRTALSLTSVSLDSFAPAALLTEYDNIRKTFESSLVVGGVVPNEEGTKQGKAEGKSRSDVNEIKNLGF